MSVIGPLRSGDDPMLFHGLSGATKFSGAIREDDGWDSKLVHPALPIVYSSGKNEWERSVTEVVGEEGERRREGEGESRDTQKNYLPGR